MSASFRLRASAVAAAATLLVLPTAGAVQAAVRVPVAAQDSVTATSAAPVRVPDAALRAVVATRVLFGHQSVGWNILDGLQRLYGSRGLPAPRVEEVDGTVPSGSTGILAHAAIGQNGDPGSKIDAFEDLVTNNAGRLDVALMKLCFVDVTAGTDVRAVFASYAASMDRLAQRFPDLVLLHATVPLTTSSPEDNAARQRYNRLVRQRYGSTGRVVDIAAVESTRPGGGRVTGTQGGTRYFALWTGYASDDGHLNARGGQRVGAAMAAVIAAAR